MTKEMRQALEICPEEIVSQINGLPQKKQLEIEELRLRNGQPVTVLVNGREVALSVVADCRHFEYVLGKASGQALYSVQEMLRQGFITLPGGHRLGICGSAVYRNGALFTLDEISSINFRIAREYRGVADRAVDYMWTRQMSTLIIGPPGRGKTTLLRDLIRQLSDRFSWRIGVADERMEIAACQRGKPQFAIGGHTDVLSGVRKAEGIEMLLRTMNPQWIALDEISSEADVVAMLRASYCGVSFLATAHAACKEDLMARPVYQELVKSGIFQNLLRITADRQVIAERMVLSD